MVAALWVKRYLIIVPTLESPLLPIQDTRPEYINYSATWVEWALTAAGVATFLLFFTLMSKFVTMVPISEFSNRGPVVEDTDSKEIPVTIIVKEKDAKQPV